ncbi:DinB family protein [Fictibacillus aquaticus]|uniref:DinB-like domain-containing protein n=1 Tax=Fictibacillus aquaticus TaxID=2021314 RepID=A0A235FFT7_9BACL|nr:DinB family protein [Fictibacillus aquaticus]OYD59595.1 hypothetical protein CGZ90_06815 [Fictibacillus aquaticus]
MNEAVSSLAVWKEDIVRISESVSEGTWKTPAEAGKWSIGEVVGHILYWDLYLIQEGLPSILNTQSISFPDHDEYNAKSIMYIEGKSKTEIVNEALRQRDALLSDLSGLSEEKWENPISINGVTADEDSMPYTLKSLMLEFAEHDRHHVNQLLKIGAGL